jgi:hypothetical protein
MADYKSLRWFNLSAPHWLIAHRVTVCPWNIFNRRTSDGDHFWGVGILQIGNRHLFAVTFSGVSILFIGRIP